MIRFVLSFCAVASIAVCATTYDLRSSWVSNSNPNGVWSYTSGGSALPYQSTGGTVAAGNGFFGPAANFSTSPFIWQASADGSTVGGYSNLDFVSGDILAHSHNSSDPSLNLLINWTAPADGFITYSGAIWFAHNPVNRRNDWSVELNGGAALNSGSVAKGSSNRSNQSTFSSSGAISVASGDVLTVRLARNVASDFGSIAGLNFSVEFDETSPAAVPEPGTWSLAAAGLALAAIWRRRS